MIATAAIVQDLAQEAALRASINLGNPVLALAAAALELP
jgi:hypothetical protein